MLHEFLTEHRAEIITRCRARIAGRPAPRPTDEELEYGVPLFLDQLADTLRLMLGTNPAIGVSATKHGYELLNRGFTIAQVVHDYGGVCQTITELANELAAPITANEFQTLNLCLDDAIADAVTEYARLREHEGTERMGCLAHELRNLINTASLSLDVLKTGSVGVGGSTGAVLSRSLLGLRNLVDRQLAEVRIGSGVHQREQVLVRDLIEEVEVSAALDANTHGLRFSVIAELDSNMSVSIDRQIFGSVLSNLLQNAFKFTRPHGDVVLRVHASPDRVVFDVEDQCGGLPLGDTDMLFRPFEQQASDRTGLGLGLAICRRGVLANDGEIHVLDRPGVGCVFSVALPRREPPTTQ